MVVVVCVEGGGGGGGLVVVVVPVVVSVVVVVPVEVVVVVSVVVPRQWSSSFPPNFPCGSQSFPWSGCGSSLHGFPEFPCEQGSRPGGAGGFAASATPSPAAKRIAPTRSASPHLTSSRPAVRASFPSSQRAHPSNADRDEPCSVDDRSVPSEGRTPLRALVPDTQSSEFLQDFERCSERDYPDLDDEDPFERTHLSSLTDSGSKRNIGARLRPRWERRPRTTIPRVSHR